MLLSIIIVNYNVRYFLEQCLCSVEKAVRAALPSGPGAEIIVVDNHSSDGSAEELPARFPQVQFILNDDNKGFGAANNQAIGRARGEYILFLNPDTILPEDCFSVCLAFMRSNPQAGAAGVRMIDGSGLFLKESRRGFPTPWVAFCKLTGLTSIFPRSPLFAGYYLGGIIPVKDHPSPILSGAFMFVRKEALDKTGGFDERFFLYAEDIDLSYRIEQAGYTNYFIADSILHFKGESTPRDEVHIKYFYRAMSLFRRKHFSSPGSRLFNLVMEPAIWLRAALQKIREGLREKSETSEGQDSDQVSRRIWVCGDPQESARVMAILSGSQDIILSNSKEADEVIFCEGPAFSFKDIIHTMEYGFPGNQPGTYKIHGKATAAAVGSASSRRRGDVIKL
jgi:N-acetylglucosaminyl-diphospho-decaprenol L-rhamnosyltransferase